MPFKAMFAILINFDAKLFVLSIVENIIIAI